MIRRHLQVLTSFSFLRVRGWHVRYYKWVYPTVLSVILFLFRKGISYDEGEIISDLMSLLGVLIGFYIAALAAVASFQSEILDSHLKGPPTTLKSHRKGKTETETLTRRRFLCVVFGYCASMSIVLYTVGMCLRYVITGDQILHDSVTLVFFWGLSSLFIVTLLGLHYLVDRMHRE